MEVLGLLGAIGMMYMMYKLLFADFSDLMEAVGYWFTPDAYSFFKGEGMEDFFAELKLGVLAVSGIGTYFGIAHLMGF